MKHSPPLGPAPEEKWACSCLQPSITGHSWLLQPQPLALSHLLQHHRSTQASRHLPRLCTTSKPFCQPSACPQQGVTAHSHGLLQDLVQELRTAFISASSCHLCQAFSVLHLAFAFPFCLGSSYEPVAMEIPNCKPLLGLSSPRKPAPESFFPLVCTACPGCVPSRPWLHDGDFTGCPAEQPPRVELSLNWSQCRCEANPTAQARYRSSHHTPQQSSCDLCLQNGSNIVKNVKYISEKIPTALVLQFAYAPLIMFQAFYLIQ